MIRLGDIVEKISAICSQTLRTPTHIVISQKTANALVDQYNELANSDADTVYELGLREYTIKDVGYFLGLSIILSTTNYDDFRIFEEITPDS